MSAAQPRIEVEVLRCVTCGSLTPGEDHDATCPAPKLETVSALIDPASLTAKMLAHAVAQLAAEEAESGDDRAEFGRRADVAKSAFLEARHQGRSR